jgi:uncharacterized repeat protein (TIGR03803 family)
LAALGLAIAALAPGQPHAANLVPLVSFNGADGANPLAGLIADANGNLFGTTALGGASGDGTVFEITFFAGTPGRREPRTASAIAIRRWPRDMAASMPQLRRSTTQAQRHCRTRLSLIVEDNGGCQT